MTFLRWFISSDVRNAVALRKHVQRILSAQRDILTPQAIANVKLAQAGLTSSLNSGMKGEALKNEMVKLDETCDKWIKKYPNAGMRENVEVLLVALAVAMAIRTFFLQPFKIPTGSMQPTLFGVTSVPDFTKVDFWKSDRAEIMTQLDGAVEMRNAIAIPNAWGRFKEWFQGISYVHLVAQADGKLERIDPPLTIKLLDIKQSVWNWRRRTHDLVSAGFWRTTA